MEPVKNPYEDQESKPGTSQGERDPWMGQGGYSPESPQQYGQHLPPGSYPDPEASSNKEERMWAMLCHLSSFAVFIIPTFGNIIAPLVVWLVKRDQFHLVDDQGKESMNFQISLTIYMIISIILSLVLIGIPVLVGLSIFWFVMVIIASVKSYEGGYYRYPLTIRFIN